MHVADGIESLRPQIDQRLLQRVQHGLRLAGVDVREVGGRLRREGPFEVDHARVFEDR